MAHMRWVSLINMHFRGVVHILTHHETKISFNPSCRIIAVVVMQ